MEITPGEIRRNQKKKVSTGRQAGKEEKEKQTHKKIRKCGILGIK